MFKCAMHKMTTSEVSEVMNAARVVRSQVSGTEASRGCPRSCFRRGGSPERVESRSGNLDEVGPEWGGGVEKRT